MQLHVAKLPMKIPVNKYLRIESSFKTICLLDGNVLVSSYGLIQARISRFWIQDLGRSSGPHSIVKCQP